MVMISVIVPMVVLPLRMVALVTFVMVFVWPGSGDNTRPDNYKNCKN